MRVKPADNREPLLGTNHSLFTGTLVLVVLYFAREVFVPLALAGLLAFLLAPAAGCLERWKIKRAPAALLVIFLSLAGVAILGWMVLGQIYSLAVELPQYQENLISKIDSLHLNSAGRLGGTVQMLSNIGQQITSGGKATQPPDLTGSLPESTAHRSARSKTSPSKSVPGEPMAVRVEPPADSFATMFGRTVGPLVHPVTTISIVVVFLVFILLGRHDLRERALRLAGRGRWHVTTTAIEDASARVSRYLQMQLIVNLCYGAIVGGALWMIGVPKPLVWGVLTCLLRFIPYIGILISMAGPLLVSIAFSAHWSELIWTVLLFLTLEVVAANFLEPMLYGASTGMSAIAILIAAIFWTLIWGLPGLFLSTPLTVCLIVIGRQVPQLRFLDVLFGEEQALSPPSRFYQRLLSSSIRDARALLEEQLKINPRAVVYDSLLVPVLTMIQEARYSEEITPMRTEEMLQEIEEILEETTIRRDSTSPQAALNTKIVVCFPARELADEVACQLASHLLVETASITVMTANYSNEKEQHSLQEIRPDIICVVGVPPRAIRSLRMRCHQVRLRFPKAQIVACVLNAESDLSTLRSRIPIEDAEHVVSSLQLMEQYLTSLLQPSDVQTEPHLPLDSASPDELSETVQQLERVDLFDGSQESIFSRLASNLARAFEAPIALINVMDGQRRFWEAQCGLPEASLNSTDSSRDLSICSKVSFSDSTLVIPDIEEDQRFSSDCFLKDRSIRFYAGAPLKDHDGKVIGSLCVLDTRPRQFTEHQKQTLIFLANSVMTAIELHVNSTPEDLEVQQD